MADTHHIYIVDDDRVAITMTGKLLKQEGYRVSSNTSSTKALAEIVTLKPDCVLLDIMMPEMDGLEILKRLRNEPSLDQTKLVVVSGKSYEFDRKRAFGFGADGYITKPIEIPGFVEQLKRIISDSVEMAFWGIHGTLPIPGKDTIRYGGNTSCMTLEFSRGNLFIFDAGTGIKQLSDQLLKLNKPLSETKIFISHPHWDHINALPFFGPLYIAGNEIEICGPSQGDIGIYEMISGQMDGVYFPIKVKEFSANVSFRDLKEEAFDVDSIHIKTMLLTHPGYCLGYRVEYRGHSICYMTDNEIFPESNRFYNRHHIQLLEDFVKETDALITDTTYMDDEYEKKIAWGHSSIGQVTHLAHRAGVKCIYLYHHDTEHTDEIIDRKLENALDILKQLNSKTGCIAPREKQSFYI